MNHYWEIPTNAWWMIQLSPILVNFIPKFKAGALPTSTAHLFRIENPVVASHGRFAGCSFTCQFSEQTELVALQSWNFKMMTLGNVAKHWEMRVKPGI